jgi:hypothetical protein
MGDQDIDNQKSPPPQAPAMEPTGSPALQERQNEHRDDPRSPKRQKKNPRDGKNANKKRDMGRSGFLYDTSWPSLSR